MRYYFMGICGTAMGNAALLLKAAGHEVIGADQGIYPPMSHVLATADITTLEGYDPERLEKLQPDCVVVGNVISRGNPEIEWLLKTRRFPYVSLPQLLHDSILSQRKSIVISGTHGKTTTSTIAAWLLQQAGKDPGWLIGGVPHDLPGGSQLGKNDAPFVIEGDEYDSAFFDKRSKFIHYCPHILAINNCEFDHADIFYDLRDVLRTFRHVTRLVPSNGFILANADDPNVAEIISGVDWCSILTVGQSEASDLRIADFSENEKEASFSLYYKGQHWVDIKWQMTGLYNARNAAMGALSAALSTHPEDPTTFDLPRMEPFKGVKRRQEILVEKEKVVVIEDFGHHPTAIRLALESLRNRYPGAYLTAAFEPRSNTARTRIFQEQLPQALLGADQVLLGAVHRADRLPPDERLDTHAIAGSLRMTMPRRDAEAFASNEELLTAATESYHRRKGSHHQVFIFFSNGSFDGIIHKFADRAQ